MKRKAFLEIVMNVETSDWEKLLRYLYQNMAFTFETTMVLYDRQRGAVSLSIEETEDQTFEQIQVQMRDYAERTAKHMKRNFCVIVGEEFLLEREERIQGEPGMAGNA